MNAIMLMLAVPSCHRQHKHDALCTPHAAECYVSLQRATSQAELRHHQCMHRVKMAGFQSAASTAAQQLARSQSESSSRKGRIASLLAELQAERCARMTAQLELATEKKAHAATKVQLQKAQADLAAAQSTHADSLESFNQRVAQHHQELDAARNMLERCARAKRVAVEHNVRMRRKVAHLERVRPHLHHVSNIDSTCMALNDAHAKT